MPPNIILILTDHWRGDCLGRLGHPVAETPHLDSISAEGVTFVNGYTPSPSCVPARRCLMTGLTPNGTGFLGYRDNLPWPYEQTLAGELSRGGYQTINVGKTHFHPRRAHLGFEQLITPQDYEEWIEGQTRHPRAKYAHGVHPNSWMSRPNHLPETQMEETWLVSQAIDRLDKRDPTRPFFLCLSFNGPHPPWCPPRDFFDMFIDREMPPPVVGDWAAVHAEEARYPLDVNAWRGKISDHLNQRARAGYFAYLAYLDVQIGRLTEYLGGSGQMSDTAVCFTSDHGEMLGDHNLWRKTYAYEASARVPMILRLPHGHGGERNLELDAVVGWEDIMPTFLDLAGLETPRAVEGRSTLPLVVGESAEWREYYHHEHAPCYHPQNCYQSLTSSRWKYIWNPVTGAEQLFDLESDPQETAELSGADAHAETLAELRSRMARHLEGRAENWSDGSSLTPGPYPVVRGDVSGEVAEKLG